MSPRHAFEWIVPAALLLCACGGSPAPSSGTGGSAGAVTVGGGAGTSGAGGVSGTSGGIGAGGNASGSGGAGGSAGGTAGAGGTGATGGLGGSAGASAGASGGGQGGSSGSGGTTTSWVTFDPATVVARSNVVLARANSAASQFMPIGNGKLGVAVWAANGFTAQLNRADTFPDRKSPGWLTIPGLARLTGAADFHGTLDLYNAVLIESGGGMTARIYVRADSDELVVDVTGADPNSTQSASVTLWNTRAPQAQASGAVATLSETWLDNSALGNSGQRFGSLGALTAGGRNVQATTGTRMVTVNFQPNSDGSFRVVCGSPKFDGSTAAATLANSLLGSDATRPSAELQSAHESYWHDFWARLGLVKLSSSDGSAEYIENLRALYYYVTAAESRGALPGSQAGVADLFSFNQDSHQWYPAGYWFWNLRMQVAANLSGGAFELNAPVYNLYTSNLANMQVWTRARMGNRLGICLPETMRFNGNGYYAYNGNQSCDQTIAPTFNSLTLSSGAEVGLWVWRQYLMTGDRSFLQTNYPVMAEAARFLLAYATQGNDGLLHTQSNAHETQWNVTGPITDIAAMRALFPAVVAAAQTLATDASLVSDLQAVIPKLPPFPRTDMGRTQVLTPSADGGNDIFAYSTQPTAAKHNVENLDLEPVWPYDLISDGNATEFAVARRTYTARANHDNPDWNNDAIHAARLGLGSEVSARIAAVIGRYQAYPSGFAAFDPNSLQEPYVEALGVLATAINEAIVQDFDGVVRIAPAWPAAWGLSGSAYIRSRSKVDVQFQSGALQFAVLEAGTTETFTVRAPWSGAQATVIDDMGQSIVAPTTGDLSISAQQGHVYLIKRSADPTPSALVVTGVAATAVKALGTRTIGVR